MSFRFRVACALMLVATVVPAVPAQAATYERLRNGSFDIDLAYWWSTKNLTGHRVNGELCATVPAGTVNAWDVMIGQSDVPFERGQPYKLAFTARASRNVSIRVVGQMAVSPYTGILSGQKSVTTSTQSFEITGTAAVDEPKAQLLFQVGGAKEPYDLCLDDVSLTGGVIPPGGRDLGSPVRVNQVGYLPDGPKRATIVSGATSPLPWRLLDATGVEVAAGRTTVYGGDVMSGDQVHLADFSQASGAGSGYRLEVGGWRSVPFDIAADLYGRLRKDSLAYFYHNRSGIPIEAAYVGAAYARPAGHLDVAPNQGDGERRGGWYDAGDHGKYVVNGALAAWELIDSYEQSGSVSLSIPEAGGGLPDVLDEARWELDFLLRMQREDGMVHHKIHDIGGWTGMVAPHEDPRERKLFDPSTAATLNLAAVGARCARVYRPFDAAFAAKCLDAAQRAWNAAKANPAVYASATPVPGGGTYADEDVSDEFSWAAAELYTATGSSGYLDSIRHTLNPGNFYWAMTGGLADLALARAALVPGPDGATKENPNYPAARTRIIGVADTHLADLRRQGYPNPDLPGGHRYFWGSTGGTAQRAMVMGMAYSLTRDPKYRDGALESLDYLLGRNALNQSYVTGYGERASQNQHHRFWAHQANPARPHPAPGSLAGGPNSDVSDQPKVEAEKFLVGCAPAKCYVDDINSYATNEVAINWNSALAWLTAFADMAA
ncbi:glycoside hydrolase family 9 protein [Streptosporangium sp. CA-135522]|uniref:glycoside hydrolase family 9 protein n=1 Tax=Streptosporangium sp. CA-135522 TaxID=3240072 RepID=UPI003D8D3AEC